MCVYLYVWWPFPPGGTALVLCSSLVCLSESDHYSQLKPEKKKENGLDNCPFPIPQKQSITHNILTCKNILKLFFSVFSGESLLSFPISAFRPSSSSFFFSRLRATAVSPPLSSLRLPSLGRKKRSKGQTQRKAKGK